MASQMFFFGEFVFEAHLIWILLLSMGFAVTRESFRRIIKQVP